MINSKVIKTLILGSCITVLSTGVAFADTGGGDSPSDTGLKQLEIKATVGSNITVSSSVLNKSSVDEDILKKQREIDKYLFEDHSDEIANQGFKVTYTGPLKNIIEIGISPYTEENAEYLYNIFGKDQIKVIEGEEAVLMRTSGLTTATALSPELEKASVDEDIIKKQGEVDKYLFEDNKDEIADKGFIVIHTGPFDNYVEIGIKPYTEENAEYLYGIFGRDEVKVVEGQQAELMYSTDLTDDSDLADDSDKTGSEEDKKDDGMGTTAPLVAAGSVIAIGGATFIVRKQK
ncbi:MAG: hypothetical protein FH761_07355 [Firmicutes bacterium]|nr:hypothetical protein [Bacillota bacterium]